MSGSILTINAGSSSLKFALFDNDATPVETVRGEIENLGAAPHFRACDKAGKVLAEALRGPLLRISRKLRQESQKVGLSVQDTVILGYLRKNPGAGVSELADFEQTSRPTMSSHVKRLEAAGWIMRALSISISSICARGCARRVRR